jgi:hypothetical protein
MIFPNYDTAPALEFTRNFLIPGLKPWAIHRLTLSWSQLANAALLRRSKSLVEKKISKSPQRWTRGPARDTKSFPSARKMGRLIGWDFLKGFSH